VSALLSALVAKGGLVAIMLTMTAESAGVPISSEIVVPLGGYLARQGLLSLAGVVAAASAGNVIGSSVAFALSRRYGPRLLTRHGRWLGLHEGHLRLAERFFGRFGMAAVFVGRLLPVVRTYISFPAGLSRMTWPAFLIATFAGCIPWNLALAFAGLWLGGQYQLVERAGGPVTVVAAACVLIVLVVAYQIGRRAAPEPAERI
jgi:membrane protein DedA with SNARE-associated domain